MHAIETLLAPVGSLADKLRIATFRHRVCQANSSDLIGRQTATALERLTQMGFSTTIIDRFFRPFFGGIFLDDSLSISAGLMEFVFRTFSLGLAALPAEGMQAIPTQIADDLPSGSIHLRTTVSSVSDGKVVLSNGQTQAADIVIVATEEPAARRLLGLESGFSKERPSRKSPSTCCLYFEVNEPPINEPTLLLNGQRNGIINNLCFPSFAQPTYAPPGKALLSVSTIGQNKILGDELLHQVREELTHWFGPRAKAWNHLRTYSIPYALPNQSLTSIAARDVHPQVSKSIWRCGDYCETGSIEGAIQSGLATAKGIIADR